MRRCLTILFCALVMLGASASAEDRDADHAALRALRDQIVEALNHNDADRLAACLAPDCSLTFVDQRHFTSASELAAYAEALRRERGITSIKFSPTSDGPARFLGADAAFATGTSQDSFIGSNGATTVIDSRWTATLQRTTAGWRVATLHVGVDLINNPILHHVRRTMSILACAGAGAALVIGLGLGWWIARRRRA